MAESERIKSFIDRLQNKIIEYRKRLDKRQEMLGIVFYLHKVRKRNEKDRQKESIR